MDDVHWYDELIAEASDLVAQAVSISSSPNHPSSASDVRAFQDTFQLWFERSLNRLPAALGEEFRRIASAPVVEGALQWTMERFVASPTAQEPDLQPYDGRTGHTISPQRYHLVYPVEYCFERPMDRLTQVLRRGKAQAQLGTLRQPDPAPAAPGYWISDLHPKVVDAIGTRFADGHFDDAVLKAAQRLIAAVAAISGQSAKDASKMMEVAFSPGDPLVEVYREPRDRRGAQALFLAAALGIRNRLSHPDFADPMSSIEAFEWLSFLSALFRLLDRRIQ